MNLNSPPKKVIFRGPVEEKVGSNKSALSHYCHYLGPPDEGSTVREDAFFRNV
jgi:hypothetical protein